ncbi:hypothetical protein L8S34_04905, partial [Enterobacter roggenkampii]
FLRTAVNDFMDSVHHIWCPLSSQEYQDLPDGAETTLTIIIRTGHSKLSLLRRNFTGVCNNGTAKMNNATVHNGSRINREAKNRNNQAQTRHESSERVVHYRYSSMKIVLEG